MTGVKTRDMARMGLFIVLITVGAMIRIPIPVMPFTLQYLFTALAGLLLGPTVGAMTILFYVAIGLLGVPIFTGGGGPAYVLQPTFGYLLGFAAGARVTGTIAHKSDQPSFWRLAWAAFAGLLVVYACGMVYYWFIYHFYVGTGIGLWTLFLYCFLLAVPGDVLLCGLAASVAKRLLPLQKMR